MKPLRLIVLVVVADLLAALLLVVGFGWAVDLFDEDAQ